MRRWRESYSDCIPLRASRDRRSGIARSWATVARARRILSFGLTKLQPQRDRPRGWPARHAPVRPERVSSRP